MNEVWKPVLGHGRYEVSESGKIRRIGRTRLLKPQVTTKGYHRVTLLCDSTNNYIGKRIHRLVAFAFLGLPPDTERTMVNHKDGIKTSNHYTNLEWVSNRENIDHAVENNLIRRSLRVRVYDTLTGHMEIIPSMEATAVRFNIGPPVLKQFLSYYPDVKLNDRYLFEPLLEEHVPANYKRNKTIIAYDYVAKKKVVAGNVGSMGLLLGLAANTIDKNLRRGRFKLVGGYVFKYLSDTTPFPEYSVNEARVSRETYIARRLNKADALVVHYPNSPTLTVGVI